MADKLSFAAVARGLNEFLQGCDLCGFNLKRFDLRVLYCEFQRVGIPFDLSGRAIVDPMEMYHRMEPRNLAAAVRHYLSQEHEAAHSAEGDTLATLEVLDAMVGRYPDLPRDPSGIHEQFRDPNAVDSGGFLTRVEGEIRFANGKFRGQPLTSVAERDPGYLRWVLGSDFFEDTTAIVAEALGRTVRC